MVATTFDRRLFMRLATIFCEESASERGRVQLGTLVVNTSSSSSLPLGRNTVFEDTDRKQQVTVVFPFDQTLDERNSRRHLSGLYGLFKRGTWNAQSSGKRA